MLGDVLVRKYSNAPDPDRAVIASDANAALSRAIELDAANVPAYAALVDLQLNCNVDPAKLRETLTKIRSLTDGKASPAASMWTARSALERRLGDDAAAKASIARALTFDPKNAAAMFAAASFAIDGGDIGRAKAIWAELATQKSVDPDALNLLNANIAAAEGAFDEALKLLGEIKQPTAQAVELKAKITTARSQDPADLEKQLAADLKNAAVLGRLCAMYRRSDPARALDYCRRASESEPNNIQHAVGFAAALVQAKQFGQAVVLLQRLIALAPGNATLHANLATALFELKRYSEARTEFDWLVADQPSAAAPYFFLGIIHDRSTEFVDSLAAYEQYLKLADPVANKDEIDKVNLRLPALRTLVKKAKGKKSGS
jgi:tetratricopeptide (TPR) repeat protein